MRTIADRLKPYQVAHSLIHRLEIYDVSRPASQFRTASWNTLLYWQMLLDGADPIESLSDLKIEGLTEEEGLAFWEAIQS